MQQRISRSYRNQELNRLVYQLNNQTELSNKCKIKDLTKYRKIHTQISYNTIQHRPYFNNKTKHLYLFQQKIPQNPYIFIPKYKNQTFIMPDKVFQKGKAAKRLYVQMKDSSIQSFRDCQDQKINQVLNRREKDKTINGRYLAQFDRIIDQNDGRKRAKKYTKYLKNINIFSPTKTRSDYFNQFVPLLEPQPQQLQQIKKTSLTKTIGPNLWRPSIKVPSFTFRNQSLSKTIDAKSTMVSQN